MKKWILFFILIFVGSLFIIPQTRRLVVSKFSALYDEIFKRWGAIRDLDWRLLKAVAYVESSINPNATGDDGRSHGMMQVSNLVGSSFGMSQDDLYSPEFNVQVGSGFLAEMIGKFGLEGGVQAYNLGETKYRKGYASPTYLSKVLNAYDELKMEA